MACRMGLWSIPQEYQGLIRTLQCSVYIVGLSGMSALAGRPLSHSRDTRVRIYVSCSNLTRRKEFEPRTDRLLLRLAGHRSVRSYFGIEFLDRTLQWRFAIRRTGANTDIAKQATVGNHLNGTGTKAQSERLKGSHPLYFSRRLWASALTESCRSQVDFAQHPDFPDS